ncbi:MAG: YfiT family bacillithiol transferase [Cyclobacteriaceae bacterium]
MDEQALEKLQYPIGKLKIPLTITSDNITTYIDQISVLPSKIRQSVQGLTDEQLDTPYRPGGWTVRKVVHHLADSHINSYIRFRWTLTEDQPTIKAYDEKSWAALPDACTSPVDLSLDLLDALHNRWVVLLKSLTADDMQKSYIHPDTQKAVRLDKNIALYAWHGDHHLAHIESLKERMGW